VGRLAFCLTDNPIRVSLLLYVHLYVWQMQRDRSLRRMYLPWMREAFSYPTHAGCGSSVDGKKRSKPGRAPTDRWCSGLYSLSPRAGKFSVGLARGRRGAWSHGKFTGVCGRQETGMPWRGGGESRPPTTGKV